jgi:hypothetical protein
MIILNADNKSGENARALSNDASNKKSIWKKLHRWPGLIISFILLYYGITGIFMNHRELFSGIDLKRRILPEEYSYKNWNNASLKGNLIVNNDSILIWGTIGVWSTDSAFTEFVPLNAGFPKGTDNRRIADLHRTAGGYLYSATLFGLYAWDGETSRWVKIAGKKNDRRFTAIESRGDTLYALSRSLLYTGISHGANTILTAMELEAPKGYTYRTGLFETIWQFHSGEIFGLPGKLFVDLLGLITIFLSVTGIIYFFFPDIIKRRMKKNRDAARLVSISRWSLKWHNKAGEWFFAFLILLYFSGIFLRPPLLIAIAEAKVKPIRFSHLDQPNPWYDKLRDLVYDNERGLFMLSTLDGMYSLKDFTSKPEACMIQPPVSVMGINIFEPFGEDSYLVGSFSGIFLWHPDNPHIYDYARGRLWQGEPAGRPVGEFKVSGMITDLHGRKYMADYDLGLIALHHDGTIPGMPENILAASGISLWSVALEIHTGRIFNFLIGGLYILIVPLAGLTGVTVVTAGYLLWRRKYRNPVKKVRKQ